MLITTNLFAQVDYQSWLDSIDSQTYIGMEVWLDEFELSTKKNQHESAAVAFYKNNPLNSTEEVLSRLSGISMIRRGNYAWQPTINGLSGGQINVTIDGMRMFGACTDKMDPVSSYIEPNNMESLVIEKGGAGSVHGSTIGGAVNFDLKRPKFNSNLSGSFNSRYESIANGISNSGSVSYGGERLAIRMNAGYRHFQDYTDGNGDEVYHSGYKKFNYSFSGSYLTIGKNLVTIDLLLDDARDIGYPGLPMDVAFAKAKIGAVDYLIFNPLPWVEQVEMKIYANTVDHLMDDSKRLDVPVRMDMPGETKTYGAFAHGRVKKGAHLIQAKLDGYFTNAYAEMTMFVPNEADMFMLTWPDVDRQDVGFYVSDQWQMSKRMTTNINWRIEHAQTTMNSEMGQNQFGVFGFTSSDYTRNHLVLNAGASIDYQWSRSWSSKLAVSYGERLPSVSEMYGFYLYNNFDGFDYVGNPLIKKEGSYQLNASMQFRPNARLSIDISGFNYWFNNYIIGLIDSRLDAMTIEANGTKTYQNIEGVTFRGFDLLTNYSPLDHIQLLYSAKMTYAADKHGNPLPQIPPLKNNFTVVATLQNFKIQAESEWALAQNRVNVSAGEIATDSYYLIHLRATRLWKLQSLNVNGSLGIENLFNTSYREHLDWGGVPRPGRNFYVSCKLSF